MPTVIDLDDYVTSAEATEAVGIAYPALMARIDRGTLPTVQKGRFHLIHRDVVDALRKELEVRRSRKNTA